VNLDAALRAWPEVEKSPMELDESAQAIVDRVRSGQPAASAAYLDDENLLGTPLGQSVEDGHNSAASAAPEVSKMTMPADRERDRRSLQDLAKMASAGLTPPPPSVHPAPSGVQRASEPAGAAKGDDSGLIDFGAMSAQAEPAPAPASMRSAGLASQGLFDEDPQSVRPPPSAQLVQPVPSIPPMPASMPPQSLAPIAPAPASMAPVAPALASASQPALQANPKKGNGAVIALVFGGVVALGAAAAGTFFYLKSHPAAATAPVAATQAPAPEVKTTPAAPAATEAAAAPTETGEPTLDPNSLPTATPDQKLAAAPKTAAKPATGAAKAAPAPAPEAKAEAKLTQKDLPSAPTGPGGDLGKAMAGAVGDEGKTKAQEPVPAAGSNVPAGSVPQKPSQGAVTGAIGAVLRNARECLGPDDPVSHATIVFGSDGAVQSVNVSGAAAGKPAEACIKGALSKAKVGPFAEPSYSTRITVRHN
jgi:hypothetical protein